MSIPVIARKILRVLVVSLFFALAAASHGVTTQFSAGSFIIPMDTSAAAGQDQGMLRAYGLVYELLRNGVPVYWIINPAKTANGDDFSVSVTGAIRNVRTGAALGPRSYRGGPFVIASGDAAEAFPIIQEWQGTSGDVTSVHQLIASTIQVEVARALLEAPRIAVLKDGNETIAFNNLNAAGVANAVDGVWSVSAPDVLTEADVEGPTTNVDSDGVLFYSGSGLARFGHFISLHYNTTSHTNEVVQEVRSWLAASS